MQEILQRGLEWYIARQVGASGEVCGTRDFFQARLDSFFREFTALHGLPEDEISLLTAVAGEIGNNCFDHNLGTWVGPPGCWFSWVFDSKMNQLFLIIADRGQGVFSSLKRVLPGLASESSALEVAFEKRISGRSPEQRGNGLKFVRTAFNSYEKRGLLFYSGTASARFGRHKGIEEINVSDRISTKKDSGTLALVLWDVG